MQFMTFVIIINFHDPVFLFLSIIFHFLILFNYFFIQFIIAIMAMFIINVVVIVIIIIKVIVIIRVFQIFLYYRLILLHNVSSFLFFTFIKNRLFAIIILIYFLHFNPLFLLIIVCQFIIINFNFMTNYESVMNLQYAIIRSIMINYFINFIKFQYFLSFNLILMQNFYLIFEFITIIVVIVIIITKFAIIKQIIIAVYFKVVKKFIYLILLTNLKKYLKIREKYIFKYVSHFLSCLIIRSFLRTICFRMIYQSAFPALNSRYFLLT